MSEHEAIDPAHAINTQSLEEELSSEEDLDEWVVHKNKQISSSEANLKKSSEDMEDTINNDSFTCNLPHHPSLEELNPRSLLLPITIDNYNSYTMANIDASNNVMPRSIYEYLKLANLEGPLFNEIHAERIAKNANPLVLVATASPYPDPYYQVSKSYKSFAPPLKQASSTRSNASTKFKAKEIAKLITPLSESASKEDSDPEQAQRDKDMQKNLALVVKYFKKLYKPTNNNLRTSSNSKNKNVDTTPRYKNDNQTGQFGNQRTMTVAKARETIGSQVVQQTGIQCFNCKEFGHFAKECRKPKRVKDYTYHKEKMLLCKQAEKVEKDDSNVTPESLDLCDNDIQTDQNAKDERGVLANLIANLKLDVDENKKIQKQLKKANASLALN
ncbi:integrase, catalytic region, zinc finger, CCHC-type containing protein [Tanacetum coccineum]